jgi:hypothetical protein
MYILVWNGESGATTGIGREVPAKGFPNPQLELEKATVALFSGTFCALSIG